MEFIKISIVPLSFILSTFHILSVLWFFFYARMIPHDLWWSHDRGVTSFTCIQYSSPLCVTDNGKTGQKASGMASSLPLGIKLLPSLHGVNKNVTWVILFIHDLHALFVFRLSWSKKKSNKIVKNLEYFFKCKHIFLHFN